jgi:flagellar motor switch protein FliM
LLKALSSGEIDSEQLKLEQSSELKAVNKYDFKRPNKYSKDHLRTLYMIHDNFARILSNFLSTYLRSNIQIKIATVDQTTYEDFIVSISSPVLMTMFNIKPSDKAVFMVMNAGFLFPIIDLLFGGPGTAEAGTRELTEIEISVMRKLNDRLLQNLTYAWEGVYNIAPHLVALETNTQFSQLYSPSETTAVVTLTSDIAGQESLIHICLPYIVLEPIISKLSAQTWFANAAAGKGSDLRPLIVEQLNNTLLELTAVLGSTDISVREFLQLREGDDIPLDNAVNDNIELWVGHRRKFAVQPGIIGSKKGAYIKSVHRNGNGSLHTPHFNGGGDSE